MQPDHKNNDLVQSARQVGERENYKKGGFWRSDGAREKRGLSTASKIKAVTRMNRLGWDIILKASIHFCAREDYVNKCNLAENLTGDVKRYDLFLMAIRALINSDLDFFCKQSNP